MRNGSSLSYFTTKNEVLYVHCSSVVDLLAVDEGLLYLPWMSDHSQRHFTVSGLRCCL